MIYIIYGWSIRKSDESIRSILTFSHVIEEFVLANYDCKQIASFWFATGNTPIYCMDYKGKKFAFYKTYVGAPACVGTVEDTLSEIKTA